MARSRFLQRGTLVFSSALILCCAGCNEPEKIAKKTEETLQKIDELKARRDATELPSSVLKSHPVGRKGRKALKYDIEGMQSEIAALEKRKAGIEEEVSTLQQKFSDYQAKNK